jgi:Xaa-Pro dipeptidase
MSGRSFSRREVIKTGLAAGIGAAASREAVAAESGSRRLPAPPEAATLNSKAYGQKRIAHVQAALKKAGYDALVVSNRALDYVSYVSNYHPSAMQSGVAFVPAEGAPTLFIQMYSSAHARVAKKTIWIDDVVDVPKDPMSESSSLNFYKEVLARIRDRKLAAGRIGLAGGEVDWLLVPYLQRELPRATVEDANGFLYSLAIVKDPVEVGLMRHAQRLIDEVAFPVYQRSLKPGALDADVYADVLDAMLRAGADASSTRLILGAAPFDSGTWASGVIDRRIEPNDIVLTEPIPRVRSYQNERMFTFAVGRNVPESQKRGAQVVHESFMVTLDELKPGREMRQAYEKCNNYIKSKGYAEGATVLIGHWIGVDNHQGWRITPEGTKGLILQPGMVLSWHPNIVVPGALRTCSSAPLLITDTGVENMSKVPMEPMHYVG